MRTFLNNIPKQECIPVGCVPAARRPYAGVCFPGGVGGLWGVCLVGGVLVSGPGGGGWCLVRGGLLRGGSARGGGVWSGGGVGVWSRGGVWSGGCGDIPACTEADPLPSCEQNE